MSDTAASIANFPTVKEVLGAAAPLGSPLVDGLTQIVIPRPGDTISMTVHDRIYRALIPVTTSSFDADMTPYWTQRRQEGYLERLAEFVLVCDDSGAIVGWTGYHRLAFDDFTVIYLDSTGMVPAWQSCGGMRKLMYQRVTEAAIPECPAAKPVYLTARTESPVFYRLMRGLLDPRHLFPQPAAPPPADVIQVGTALAEWLGQRTLLDPGTLILRGAYDTLDELYGELPTTGDPVLDAMFRDQLGPLDAYLLVGRAEPGHR